MNAIDQFANEARLYVEWLRYGSDQGDSATREAVIRLTQLYLAAIELPPAWSQKLEDAPVAVKISEEELRSAGSAIWGRFPFDWYSEVTDPFVVPSDETSIGSLADDLIDIYRDIVTGLYEYTAKRPEQANWEWRFGFENHWGYHATSAIRVLHHWLASHALDQLGGKP